MKNGNISEIELKLSENGTQTTILEAVRDNMPISRSAIANDTGLPRAAVTRNVTRLLNRNILIELPLADTRASRRRNGLNLNPDVGYCLSISYESDGINGCIFNSAYKIFFEDSISLNLQNLARKNKIKTIISFVEKLFSHAADLPGVCFGLAIVDPGAIDENSGVVIDCSVMEDWHNVPIVDILQKQFNTRTMLFSGSLAYIKAVDYMELRGAVDDLLYIHYGNGIGCSMKAGGNYISGHAGRAGEFGHWHLHGQERPCRCGGTGCLEAMAALPALHKSAELAIQNGQRSILTQKPAFQGHDVLLAAAEGDLLAFSLVREAFVCLGQAVGGLINTLAPQVVLFENIVGEAGNDAVSILFQTVKQNILSAHLKSLSLEISSLESYLYRISSLGGAISFLDCNLKK